MDSGEESNFSSCRSRQDIEVSSLSSANEITEDLTANENNETSSSDEAGELSGLIDLGDGEDGKREVVKPRPYQLEMLEQSLMRNIIVAVSYSLGKSVSVKFNNSFGI